MTDRVRPPIALFGEFGNDRSDADGKENVTHIKSRGQAQHYIPPMDRDSLYLLLWLIWVAFLVVGIAYVLFSAGATWL